MWKEVDGFPYIVSDNGVVKNKHGKYLRPEEIGDYLRVDLRNKNERKRILVHRLVLETYEGPCPPGMTACHNDGNPRNNEISNLRWDTQSSNIADQKSHGTQKFGSDHHNSILTHEQRNAILHGSKSVAECAQEFKVSYQTAYQVKYRHLQEK